jgi:hypothetical protein
VCAHTTRRRLPSTAGVRPFSRPSHSPPAPSSPTLRQLLILSSPGRPYVAQRNRPDRSRSAQRTSARLLRYCFAGGLACCVLPSIAQGNSSPPLQFVIYAAIGTIPLSSVRSDGFFMGPYLLTSIPTVSVPKAQHTCIPWMQAAGEDVFIHTRVMLPLPMLWVIRFTVLPMHSLNSLGSLLYIYPQFCSSAIRPPQHF